MTRPDPTPGGVFRKSNPTMLDADMTRTELVYSLENLNFTCESFTDHRRLATITIDREVRNFLVSLLRSRADAGRK